MPAYLFCEKEGGVINKKYQRLPQFFKIQYINQGKNLDCYY